MGGGLKTLRLIEMATAFIMWQHANVTPARVGDVRPLGWLVRRHTGQVPIGQMSRRVWGTCLTVTSFKKTPASATIHLVHPSSPSTKTTNPVHPPSPPTQSIHQVLPSCPPTQSVCTVHPSNPPWAGWMGFLYLGHFGPGFFST